MIKKSPKKYLIILLIIELLFMAAAFNRYYQNRENGIPREISAVNFVNRAGGLLDNSYYIDASYHMDSPYISTPDNDDINAQTYTGTFTYGPYAELKKGSYSVTLFYQTDTDNNSCYIYSNTLNSSQLKSSYRISLPKEESSVTFSITATQGLNDLELITEYCGEGSLRIDKMTITKTPDYYIRNMFVTMAICLFGILAYYLYVSDIPARKNIFCLILITLASSYPLFVDYLPQGHDLSFHLTRIDGIALGLRNGIFPVKIHPYWANDYGYAVGVFYGDAMLYLPAFLRNMGFSIQEAYKIYVFIINVATVLISWKCFHRILRDERMGLIASFLYTLAPYRLSNLYIRSSVGEYTALTFLPVVLCGFYLIFTEDYRQKGYWKNFLLPALGLTGIIQTHIISCEMVGIFIIISCLIMINRVCVLRVFLTLCLAAFTTVLLNMGFLVPFLSYFGGDFVMNSPEWFSTPIQSAGAYIAQLFPVFHNGIGSSKISSFGMAGEMPLGVGFTLFLGLLLFFYLILCDTYATEKGLQTKLAIFSFFMAVLSLFMSTSLFPWNALANLSDLLTTMVYNLQFPWRFLTIATLFLVVVTCLALMVAKKHFTKEKYLCVFAIIMCFFITSTTWFYYDILNRGDVYRPFDTGDLNSMLLGSEEYLPAGTKLSLLTEKTPVPGEGTFIQSFEKNGTTIHLHATTQTDAGYVELPLLYYEGYAAISDDTELMIEKGTNNVLRLMLPANFDSEILVYFREPFSWRIGEAISAITFIGIIIGLFITALGKRKSDKPMNQINV